MSYSQFENLAQAIEAFELSVLESVNLLVYGCMSSGLLWRFLKLEQQTVTIDLTDYPLKPSGDLLAKLMWMASATEAR